MCQILYGKKPNKKSVRKAAEHLMAIYGTTTTLEVKKYLRALGYVAYQHDISQQMDKLTTQLQWAFTFNGVFRVYAVAFASTLQINLPQTLPQTTILPSSFSVN
jgi:hypothetical protein